MRLEISSSVKGQSCFISSVEDGKQVTVQVPWKTFAVKFFENRVYGLGNLSLPKVVTYTSSLFQYKGNSCVFFFMTLNPRIVTFTNDFEENVSGFIPWTHCFVLLDRDNERCEEFVMFFSTEQIKSEFLHDFYVPNIEKEHLEKSEFLSSQLDITVPVHKLSDKNLFTYTSRTLPQFCRNAWDQLANEYMRHCEWNTVISEDPEKFISEMSSTMKDGPISISVFDDFAEKQSNSVKSLQLMLQELLVEHLPMNENSNVKTA